MLVAVAQELLCELLQEHDALLDFIAMSRQCTSEPIRITQSIELKLIMNNKN